jgi:hypothetical protein
LFANFYYPDLTIISWLSTAPSRLCKLISVPPTSFDRPHPQLITTANNFTLSFARIEHAGFQFYMRAAKFFLPKCYIIAKFSFAPEEDIIGSDVIYIKSGLVKLPQTGCMINMRAAQFPGWLADCTPDR